MTEIVIVALPEQDDHVYKISSEKVPHLTLLYLGEEVDNLPLVVQYVQHAASMSLRRFGLTVDRRGTLGDDQADVLFFEDTPWNIRDLAKFRSYLLTDPNIRKAYDSVPQYPQWTPHLTLGYPETPARPDDREYGRLNYIGFDRIAIWTGDYEGPEFRLDSYDMVEGEIAMSENPLEVGASFMENLLKGHNLHHASDDEANRFIHALLGLEIDPDAEEIFHFELDEDGDVVIHYGKKGMKWGVRNDKGHEGEKVKTKKLDKLDKKWEKENSGVKAMIKAHNSAADKMNNGEIDRINNKPEHAKASKEGKFDNWEKPTPELEAYWKDMDDTFNNHFNNALVNLGSNPSGTKRYQITVDEDGNPYAELSEIKHASVGDIDVRYKITLDSRGMITAYTMEETELKHYGVKGMRWGHRKSEGSSAVDPTQVTVTQKKPGTYVKATGGRKLPASEEAKRAAELKQKASKSTTDALSNKELQELVQRMNLEKQYRQAMFDDDRRSIGKKFIDGLFGQKRYGGEKRKYTDDWEELGESFRSKPEPEETKKK